MASYTVFSVIQCRVDSSIPQAGVVVFLAVVMDKGDGIHGLDKFMEFRGITKFALTEIVLDGAIEVQIRFFSIPDNDGNGEEFSLFAFGDLHGVYTTQGQAGEVVPQGFMLLAFVPELQMSFGIVNTAKIDPECFALDMEQHASTLALADVGHPRVLAFHGYRNALVDSGFSYAMDKAHGVPISRIHSRYIHAGYPAGFSTYR